MNPEPVEQVAQVSSDTPKPLRILGLPAAAWLVLACALVYADNLSGPLLFDDEPAILDNTTFEQPTLIGLLLLPRETPLSGRPVPNLTFVVNHALFGDAPVAYHAVNLLFHMIVVLLGSALLRTTLAHGRVPQELRTRAGPLAFVAALLFALHPICVELVLYATQRTESLLAIFYLAAILVFARAAGSGRTSTLQIVGMGALAVLGALSKEVFATAPLLVLFYDRAFFAGTFAGALRARKALYLALAFTFVPILLLNQTHPRSESVRFGELDYLVAQAKIIPEYLGTALWPAHSVFDYGPLLPQDAAAAWPWLAFTSLLVLAASWLGFLRPRLGFLGVCFFGILAPSSSVFSVHTEVGAERRIYLPLIAICGYVVVACASWLARMPLSPRMKQLSSVSLVVFAALALLVQSRAYAATFATQEQVWLLAISMRPDNPRPYYNLGETYRREGKSAEAEAAYLASLAVKETSPESHVNLSQLLIARGAIDDGLRHGARGVELAPMDVKARYSYGVSLALAGKMPEAVVQLTAAVKLAPDDVTTRTKLVLALIAVGDRKTAAKVFAPLRPLTASDPRMAELMKRIEG